MKRFEYKFEITIKTERINLIHHSDQLQPNVHIVLIANNNHNTYNSTQRGRAKASKRNRCLHCVDNNGGPRVIPAKLIKPETAGMVAKPTCRGLRASHAGKAAGGKSQFRPGKLAKKTQMGLSMGGAFKRCAIFDL